MPSQIKLALAFSEASLEAPCADASAAEMDSASEGSLEIGENGGSRSLKLLISLKIQGKS